MNLKTFWEQVTEFGKSKGMKVELAEIKLGSLETDKGVINFEGEMLHVGATVLDSENNPLPAGEYQWADMVAIVDENSTVLEIKEVTAMAEEDEAPKEEAPKTNDAESIVNSIIENETALDMLIEKLMEKISMPDMEPILSDVTAMKKQLFKMASEKAPKKEEKKIEKMTPIPIGKK